MKLFDELDRADVSPLDQEAMRKCKNHWNTIAKLPNSLGLLEDAVVKIAGITHTSHPKIRKKRIIIFCADNGVCRQDISPSAQWVTAAQAVNFSRGGGVINAFARNAGIEVNVCDIGIAVPYSERSISKRTVRPGTADISCSPAMTREECITAIKVGLQFAEQASRDSVQLLLGGEMGIGNTTTSSAVASVLLGAAPHDITSKGAGGYSVVNHKVAVIEQAIALHKPNPNDAIDVISKIGGLDIAALCGLYLGAAIYRLPVIIDGVITATAALCAAQLIPLSRQYMLASHGSAEPSSRLLWEKLELKPLITADMCLGEGTGAALTCLLLDAAIAAYYETKSLTDLDTIL